MLLSLRCCQHSSPEGPFSLSYAVGAHSNAGPRSHARGSRHSASFFFSQALIRSEIARRFGGIPEFTDFLRLRFLLRPLIFDEDVATLLARSGAEEWAFDGLREWVQPEPGCALLRLLRRRRMCPAAADLCVDDERFPPAPPRLLPSHPSLCVEFACLRRTAATNAQSLIACVSADPGAGKSTVSAALVAGLGQVPHGCPQPLVHAHHFCARGDARRSDVVAIVKTLAYQLAMVYPEIKVCAAALAVLSSVWLALQLCATMQTVLILMLLAPPLIGTFCCIPDSLFRRAPS